MISQLGLILICLASLSAFANEDLPYRSCVTALDHSDLNRWRSNFETQYKNAPLLLEGTAKKKSHIVDFDLEKPLANSASLYFVEQFVENLDKTPGAKETTLVSFANAMYRGALAPGDSAGYLLWSLFSRKYPEDSFHLLTHIISANAHGAVSRGSYERVLALLMILTVNEKLALTDELKQFDRLPIERQRDVFALASWTPENFDRGIKFFANYSMIANDPGNLLGGLKAILDCRPFGPCSPQATDILIQFVKFPAGNLNDKILYAGLRGSFGDGEISRWDRLSKPISEQRFGNRIAVAAYFFTLVEFLRRTSEFEKIHRFIQEIDVDLNEVKGLRESLYAISPAFEALLTAPDEKSIREFLESDEYEFSFDRLFVGPLEFLERMGELWNLRVYSRVPRLPDNR